MFHERLEPRLCPAPFGFKCVDALDIIVSDGSPTQLADFDQDGDQDEVSIVEGQIIWYENQGIPGPRQVIAVPADGAVALDVLDVDEDGDMDVAAVFADQQNRWCEQFQLQPGDANRDGQFNQLDIVQVLQAAQFFHGRSATWEEGDWNGNGVFDSGDIVAALQTGNYLRGPYIKEGRLFLRRCCGIPVVEYAGPGHKSL